jgi:hypothetical protein
MVEHDLKSLHRPLDVLERELSKITKFSGHPAHDSFSCIARNEDAAWRRLPFETSRNVNAIAIEIITVNDNVSDVNADPKRDTLVVASIEICCGHRPLELDSRVERIDDAGELNQRAITNQLDEPTAVASQSWFKQLGPVLSQYRQSSAFVALHQARVPDCIQRHYGGQLTALSCQSSCPLFIWTIVDRTMEQDNGGQCLQLALRAS